MNTKELRDKYEYTQEKLAELLDVSVSTVRSWEQGQRNIGSRSRKDIKKAFPNEYEEAAILNDNSVYENIDK